LRISVATATRDCGPAVARWAMAGLPFRADTRANVEKLYAEVFGPALEAD